MTKYLFRLILFVTLIRNISISNAQSTSTSLFSNEIKFERTFGNRWSGDFRVSNAWTAVPPSKNPFDEYSDYALSGWVHNYFSKSWKFAGAFQYFHKVAIDVEPLNQNKGNEFRFSGDAVYYIKKIRFTISDRSRIEFREIQNSEQEYNAALRYRNSLKVIVPLNAKRIRAGVFYGFTSEEIFLKYPNDVSGNQIFDRNRIDAGVGFAITNDVFVELYYANEFVPRSTNQINNIINLDFAFTNLLPNIKKKFFPPSPISESD